MLAHKNCPHDQLSWDDRGAPALPFFLSENTRHIYSLFQCSDHMEIQSQKQHNFSRTGSSKADMLCSMTAPTILAQTQSTCLAAGCGSCCPISPLPVKRADVPCYCYQWLFGDLAPVNTVLSGSSDGQVLMLQELLQVPEAEQATRSHHHGAPSSSPRQTYPG